VRWPIVAIAGLADLACSAMAQAVVARFPLRPERVPFSEKPQTLMAAGGPRASASASVRGALISAFDPRRNAATQASKWVCCDSVFSAELFNRRPPNRGLAELCSLNRPSKIDFKYQMLARGALGDASVICATHGQKRSAAGCFAALLYCLCKGLG
jgi:hypothetical protein